MPHKDYSLPSPGIPHFPPSSSTPPSTSLPPPSLQDYAKRLLEEMATLKDEAQREACTQKLDALPIQQLTDAHDFSLIFKCLKVAQSKGLLDSSSPLLPRVLNFCVHNNLPQELSKLREGGWDLEGLETDLHPIELALLLREHETALSWLKEISSLEEETVLNLLQLAAHTGAPDTFLKELLPLCKESLVDHVLRSTLEVQNTPMSLKIFTLQVATRSSSSSSTNRRTLIQEAMKKDLFPLIEEILHQPNSPPLSENQLIELACEAHETGHIAIAKLLWEQTVNDPIKQMPLLLATHAYTAKLPLLARQVLQETPLKEEELLYFPSFQSKEESLSFFYDVVAFGLPAPSPAVIQLALNTQKIDLIIDLVSDDAYAPLFEYPSENDGTRPTSLLIQTLLAFFNTPEYPHLLKALTRSSINLNAVTYDHKQECFHPTLSQLIHWESEPPAVLFPRTQAYQSHLTQTLIAIENQLPNPLMGYSDPFDYGSSLIFRNQEQMHPSLFGDPDDFPELLHPRNEQEERLLTHKKNGDASALIIDLQKDEALIQHLRQAVHQKKLQKLNYAEFILHDPNIQKHPSFPSHSPAPSPLLGKRKGSPSFSQEEQRAPLTSQIQTIQKRIGQIQIESQALGEQKKALRETSPTLQLYQSHLAKLEKLEKRLTIGLEEERLDQLKKVLEDSLVERGWIDLKENETLSLSYWSPTQIGTLQLLEIFQLFSQPSQAGDPS